MEGRIHSFQSMGTLDGPGVRFVAFLQGCPLRCGCCHNPDTWDAHGGERYTAEEVVRRASRVRMYFGPKGGITLSGGEPLLQSKFCTEIFRLCHEQGIHTCLDTSGCVLDEEVVALLHKTDRVLLDVKYPSDELYRQHVGCSMDTPMAFLKQLNELRIPVTLRQVIIPTLNDSTESILALKAVAQQHACVDSVELLPFRKVCQVKYDQMGMAFRFAHLPQPDGKTMAALRKLLGRFGG